MKRILRRACWAVAGLWWLVALQLVALGVLDGHAPDLPLFTTAGTLMWLIAGALVGWVLG